MPWVPRAGLGQQRPRLDVVDAGRDRNAELPGQRLGGILGPRLSHHLGGGPDESQSRRFHGLDHLEILGHEPIPGKQMGVSVLCGDFDDGGDALSFFLRRPPGIVGNPVHPLVSSHPAQFGGERPGIDHAVFFGKENAAWLGAHSLEGFDRLQPDGAPAGDEHPDVAEAEPFRPGRPHTRCGRWETGSRNTVCGIGWRHGKPFGGRSG